MAMQNVSANRAPRNSVHVVPREELPSLPFVPPGVFGNTLLDLRGEIDELRVFGDMLLELAEVKDGHVAGWGGNDNRKMNDIALSLLRRAEKMEEYALVVEEAGVDEKMLALELRKRGVL